MQGRDVTGRPVFRHLGAADGLPSASIDGLALDRKGRVWAATDMGLAVIDPGTFAVKALQRADGLALGNYWADAVAVLPGGDIVFGAIGGMTIVGADAAPHWDYKAPVVITAAQAGGVRVPVAQLADAPLVVPAADNSLSVEFAALDFSAPAKNRYRYMLEGFDNGWIETDAAHRVASYTNLPPGDYRMRLRGSNREGQITLPETTLQIRVLPAWFQTMWFRAAAVLAGMLLLAAVLSAWTAIARRRHVDGRPGGNGHRAPGRRTDPYAGGTHLGAGSQRGALPRLVQQCRGCGVRGPGRHRGTIYLRSRQRRRRTRLWHPYRRFSRPARPIQLPHPWWWPW